MEAKILVEVSVNLSENTQNFIRTLLSGSIESIKPAAKPEAKPKAKPEAKPVANSNSKTIEDVRKALSEKVNDHRDVIKQKLNELGAPSVTKLNPSYYDEMYQFLINL